MALEGSQVDGTTGMPKTDGQDTFAVGWILVSAFLVISMQLGFAMLEVGSVREAHRMTVLVKNIMDSCASCIAFWAYCQVAQPSIVLRDGIVQHHLLLFHWAFCATCVTICSGSMAERTHMLAYLTGSAVMAGVVYPIIADSAWGDGLLSAQFHGRFHQGYLYHDFAGSGVVHMLGGTSALVGNMMVGRRIMKPKESGRLVPGVEQRTYSPNKDGVNSRSVQPIAPSPSNPNRSSDEHGLSSQDLESVMEELEQQGEEEEMMLKPVGGWPRRFDDPDRDSVEFRALNYLQVTGMFTLWVGWYGFNAGSTLALDKVSAAAAGTISWNTTMAAAAGGFGAFVFCCVFRHQLDVSFINNGLLIGLVSITASCDVATPGASAIIGLIGGLVIFPLASWATQVLKLDDPVDAIPVHLFGGLYGVLSVAVCRPDCELLPHYGGGIDEQRRFCQEGHSMGKQMAAQAWGSLLELGIVIVAFLLLWGFFTVSERIRAMESELLDRADELLCQMVLPGLPDTGTVTQWNIIMGWSPLARRVLRRHGLNRGVFKEGAPTDLWRLRRELQQVRGKKAETALEGTGVCACLAQVLYHCWPVREIALLRLRISPVAELSGLGAADADGGSMLSSVRDAMLQVKQARDQSKVVHSPLRREIQELALQLRSQEALIVRLMRGRRARQLPPLESVPERTGEDTEGSPGASGDEILRAGVAQTECSSELPVSGRLSQSSSRRSSEGIPQTHDQHLPALLGRRSSDSTDETVSDRSAGALSFRSSNADDTPSPTVLSYSRMSRRRSSGSRSRRRSMSPTRAPAQPANVQDIVLGVLQAQNQLLSALQVQPPNVSGGAQWPGATPQQPPLSAMLPSAMMLDVLARVETMASQRSDIGSLESSRPSGRSEGSSRIGGQP